MTKEELKLLLESISNSEKPTTKAVAQFLLKEMENLKIAKTYSELTGLSVETIKEVLSNLVKDKE